MLYRGIITYKNGQRFAHIVNDNYTVTEVVRALKNNNITNGMFYATEQILRMQGDIVHTKNYRALKMG